MAVCPACGGYRSATLDGGLYLLRACRLPPIDGGSEVRLAQELLVADGLHLAQQTPRLPWPRRHDHPLQQRSELVLPDDAAVNRRRRLLQS